MARNGTSFRKTLSKPGLLKEVRASFERIDDGVSGRKFRLADYLMSGLAVFSLKYQSLLQFDRHANRTGTRVQIFYGVIPPNLPISIYCCCFDSEKYMFRVPERA